MVQRGSTYLERKTHGKATGQRGDSTSDNDDGTLHINRHVILPLEHNVKARNKPR